MLTPQEKSIIASTKAGLDAGNYEDDAPGTAATVRGLISIIERILGIWENEHRARKEG